MRCWRSKCSERAAAAVSMPAAAPLNHSAVLDRAAEQWADGLALSAAAQRGGYSADVTAGLRVSGSDTDMIRVLRRSSCRTVSSRDLQDIGVYRRGSDNWLLLASRYTLPDRSQAPALAARALELVNEVRARGTRCGERSFAPTSPVTLSTTLAAVAFRHAADMAEHDYFEHQDLTGRSPAQRVSAAGYARKTGRGKHRLRSQVDRRGGSRVARQSGSLRKHHGPEIRQMGIAYAPGQLSRRGLYWDQLLAAPRGGGGSVSGLAQSYTLGVDATPSAFSRKSVSGQ